MSHVIDFDDIPDLDDEDIAAMQKCGYTEEEATAFKQVYNHYDENFGKGDGKCSVALVKSMVRALGIQMSKDDEEQLAIMLEECDENKDGSTQFPEFLLLIAKMQSINFCMMNDAAAERVRAEKEAEEKKKKAVHRKEGEKAAHRASLLYLQNQDEMFSTLQKHAEKIDEQKKKDGEDSDDEDKGGLKEYDDKTDGPYRIFYWKHHKDYLDGLRAEWETYSPVKMKKK